MYEKALELIPNDIETLTNKGNALAGLKKYEEAIACYDKVISQENQFYMAYLNKGLAKIELEQYHIGIACLNKAIAINPTCAPAYNNKVYF